MGCSISMGDVGVRLFAVSFGWCGIKWSHTLTCWMVLSGETSLLYPFLCTEWMDKPSVTSFLLTSTNGGGYKYWILLYRV